VQVFFWISITSVSFSPDGRYALSGSYDKTIRLWNIESGREIRRFEGHTNHVISVSFSHDGRYALSGSDDHTIRLWDIESGREIRRFEGSNSEHANFSYDIKELIIVIKNIFTVNF
jgi:WD40 repeat protein